jgi:hypothetical protein
MPHSFPTACVRRRRWVRLQRMLPTDSTTASRAASSSTSTDGASLTALGATHVAATERGMSLRYDQHTQASSSSLPATARADPELPTEPVPATSSLAPLLAACTGADGIRRVFTQPDDPWFVGAVPAGAWLVRVCVCTLFVSE